MKVRTNSPTLPTLWEENMSDDKVVISETFAVCIDRIEMVSVRPPGQGGRVYYKGAPTTGITINQDDAMKLIKYLREKGWFDLVEELENA